jgi:hypothetical protein
VPRLEFLANMNISPLTVEGLRKIGWNIIRVSEILDKKTKDIEFLPTPKIIIRSLLLKIWIFLPYWL